MGRGGGVEHSKIGDEGVQTGEDSMWDEVGCAIGERSSGIGLEGEVSCQDKKCGCHIGKRSRLTHRFYDGPMVISNEVTKNMINEVRVTDPVTGGQKGSKAERFDLIPWQSVAAISRIYHYGATKYSARNWQKGYAWSLSYAALMRHLAAWWEGENCDRESGQSHLAHAGFHILSLLWYEITGRGTDDRYKGDANG